MLRTFLLLLSLALSLQAQAATLKIATLLPDGTSWMKMLREAVNEIGERTQGRLQLRIYPGGVMGNDNSVLRKIRVGQLQGGTLTAGGLVAINPDVQIYSMPFLFSSFEEVDYVRSRMDPILIKRLRNSGFVSYGLSEGGFVYLMSQRPVSRVEQLRENKVWAPEGDQISLSAFQALGVTPIPLPLTDVLTGLQTGMIDTIGTSPAAAIALQWHTRVGYLTDMPALYLYGSLVFSEQALGKLSPSDRQILAEVLSRTFRDINQATRSDNRNAREALQRQGIKFVTPSQEELAQWRQVVGNAMDKINHMQDFYSPELLKQVHQLIGEYRKAVK